LQWSFSDVDDVSKKTEVKGLKRPSNFICVCQ
jgi:hypothetical protein